MMCDHLVASDYDEDGNEVEWVCPRPECPNYNG